MLKEGDKPQNEWPKTKEPLVPAAMYVRAACFTQTKLDEQRKALESFALCNNMKVVRTYIEGGLPGRELKELMETVTTGSANFTTILMRDISRWGRLKDPDDIACHEYLCRKAGITIRYVQEEATTSHLRLHSLLAQ